MKVSLTTFLLILIPFISIAQTSHSLKGSVFDSLNKSFITGSTIIVEQNGIVLGYGITDYEGKFSILLTISNSGDLLITCRHISNGEKRLTIPVSQISQPIFIEVVPSSETLSSVLVNSAIRSRNDTSEFAIDSVLNLQTKKVEDLLKTLPGFELLPNGFIKYKDKSINNVLINGQNLAGANYGVVTKNLDAEVLSKVQVIDNFSENRIIGSIFKTGDVAVNLVTKESVRGKINGATKLGTSFTNRHEADVNLIALKNKLQGIFVANSNNIGENKNPDFGGAGQSSFLPGFSRENDYFNTTPLNTLSFPFAEDNYKTNERRKFIFPSVSIALSPKWKIVNRLALGSYENDIASQEFIKTTISDSNSYVLNNDARSNQKDFYFRNNFVLKYDNLKRTAMELEVEAGGERKSSDLNQFQSGSFTDSIFANATVPINKLAIKASVAHRVSPKEAIGIAVNSFIIKDEGDVNFTTNRFSNFYNQSISFDNLRQNVNQDTRVVVGDIFYLARQKTGSLQIKFTNSFYKNELDRQVFLDSNRVSNNSLLVSNGLNNASYYKSSIQFLEKFRNKAHQEITLRAAIGFYGLENLSGKNYLHYLLSAQVSGKLVSNIIFTSSIYSANSIFSPSILLKDSLLQGVSLMSLRAQDYKPINLHSFSLNLSKTDWLEYKLKYALRWIPNSLEAAYIFDPKLSFYFLQLLGSNLKHNIELNVKAYSLGLKGTFFLNMQTELLSTNGIVNQNKVTRHVTNLSPSLRFVSNFKSLYNFEINIAPHFNRYVQEGEAKVKTTNSFYNISAKQKVDFSKKFIAGFVNSYSKYRNGSFLQFDFFSSWQVNSKIRIDFKGINLANQKSFKFQLSDVNNVFRQETFVTKPYLLSSVSFRL